jgi:hypothetical protein
MNRPLLVIAVVFAALASAGSASAGVTVAGTGEPAFTNTTTNTQWITWQGSSAYQAFSLDYEYYDNNAKTNTVNVAQTANGGSTDWASWAGTPLVEGHTYGICVIGRAKMDGITFDDGSSCIDGANQNKRTSTTIDRTKPSIAVSIDGDAPFSRTASLAYRIDYSDNLAFPFPANFLCRDIGSDPGQACVGMVYGYAPACSAPDAPGQKTTFFTCTDDLSATAVADGPLSLCVISADAAVPDKPFNSNQAGDAGQANLSNRVCDSITIDRTAPTLGLSGPASATVGGLNSFTTQAADATSGLTGFYTWSWGDGTPSETGAAATHTYANPGTYNVKVATTDAAGNSSSAEKTIVVAARPQPAVPPADQGTHAGPPSTPSAPSAPAIAATLDVSAPKRVKAARLKSIPVALTAGGPGRAGVALVRSGRVHAQSAVTVGSAGTRSLKLKLPRRLPAGKYTLKIAWTPAGASAAQQISLKLSVVGPSKRKARSSAAGRVSLADAPSGLPDGRGDYRHVSHRLALHLG